MNELYFDTTCCSEYQIVRWISPSSCFLIRGKLQFSVHTIHAQTPSLSITKIGSFRNPFKWRLRWCFDTKQEAKRRDQIQTHSHIRRKVFYIRSIAFAFNLLFMSTQFTYHEIKITLSQNWDPMVWCTLVHFYQISGILKVSVL